MARITFNTTIDEGTQGLIAKWARGLTKGQVVDAAVAMYDQAQGTEKKEIGDVVAKLESMSVTLKVVKDGVLDLLSQGISVPEGSVAKPPFDAVRDLVAAVPRAESSAPNAPFQRECVHCGETFGAWNRSASTCPDCKAKRHGGDPRDCPMCLERQGAL